MHLSFTLHLLCSVSRGTVQIFRASYFIDFCIRFASPWRSFLALSLSLCRCAPDVNPTLPQQNRLSLSVCGRCCHQFEGLPGFANTGTANGKLFPVSGSVLHIRAKFMAQEYEELYFRSRFRIAVWDAAQHFPASTRYSGKP